LQQTSSKAYHKFEDLKQKGQDKTFDGFQRKELICKPPISFNLSLKSIHSTKSQACKISSPQLNLARRMKLGAKLSNNRHSINITWRVSPESGSKPNLPAVR
jgi:hypothetical protein